MPKIYFCRGDWSLDCVPVDFRDFPVISLYPKILSLMLFGNSLGNLCIEFFILDIKLRSTYGEWKLY